MERIGIFGGTFDPVHYGHLILAEQARDGVKLDRIIFVPAKSSPFKQGKGKVSGNVRREMVDMAILGNPDFSSSDLELNGPNISYTIHTLEAFRKELGPDSSIHFICGTDAFLSIESWLEADSILRNFPLIVGGRPKYKDLAREQLIRKLKESHSAQIEQVFMPKIDISSTDIKSRVRQGKSIKYLVPPAVEDYIHQKELYL